MGQKYRNITAFKLHSMLSARDIQGDEARHGKAFEGLLNRYFGK